MIFGKKYVFSIEADFYHNEPYSFVSYCFFVNGYKIGDNKQTSLLGNFLDNVEYNLKMHSHRKCKELLFLNYKEIFNFLNYHLWGVGFSSFYMEPKENIDRLSVIQDYGECLDGFFCYLLELEEYDLLIWNDENNEIMRYNIPKGDFYKSFAEVDKWIKRNKVTTQSMPKPS